MADAGVGTDRWMAGRTDGWRRVEWGGGPGGGGGVGGRFIAAVIVIGRRYLLVERRVHSCAAPPAR